MTGNAAASAPLHGWIAARGALVDLASEKIDPVGAEERFGAADRTIFARKSIQPREVLVTLRAGAFLNGSSWLARIGGETEVFDGKALVEAVNHAQLSATVLTALALLNERAAGSASAFAGYIAQLPTAISLPLAWSKAHQQLLKHTTAFPLMDAELVENVYSRYVEPLAAKFPAVWAKEGVSLADFRWAYAVVSSRAFTIGDGHEPTLLPVIDMANHDADDPAARIEKTEAGEFQLVTTRDITEGDAVTISYGDLSNAQLLCRYGFVLPTPAPSDSILITSGELSSTYKAYLHSATAASDDDDDNDDDDNVVAVAATGGSGKKKAAKRRKVFDTREESDGDALFFLLHGDQSREFGLGDALLSYVMATGLPAEELYEVLTIILRKKDKQYSDALASLSSESDASGDGDAGARRVAALLSQHERQVCRRVLLGLVTLEESSSEDDEEEEEEEEEEDDEGEGEDE